MYTPGVKQWLCLAQTLKGGVMSGADSAAGWKALAELQYQNRQWAAAYETSVRGLEWSVRRRASGCETLTHFALALRLCAARCLRRLGRLDEAEYAFKVLAGMVQALSSHPPCLLTLKEEGLDLITIAQRQHLQHSPR